MNAHEKERNEMLSKIDEEKIKALKEQPVKIDIRKELASIEFMGVNDARDSETIARHFYELGRQSKPMIVFSKEVFDQYDREQFINAYKPKVCEGLDGEITEFIANHYEVDYYDGLKHHGEYLDTYDVEEIARHFAKWGAEHRGSSEIPNDLEEAADELAEGHGFVKKPNCKPAKYPFSAVRDVFIEGVKAGAKWQMGKDLSSINKSYESGVVFGMNAQKEQDDKELSEKIASAYQLGLADKEKQMMKEAVEAEVFEYQSPLLYPEYYDDNPGPPAITLERDSVKPGDKVRIIILPPED